MAPSAGFAIYEKILTHMADGVISLDLEGRVVTFNPAAGRLLAVSDEEAVGRPYAATFFAESRFDQLNDLVLKAILEAEIVHSEAIQVETPERLRHLNVSTSFLRDSSGAPIGVIVVLSDVTNEHRRRKLKRLFGEYLDPRIIERLSETADQLDHGVRQVATISFLDLEGFTRLGERLGAAQLVRFLNQFLSLMSEPIGKRGGITDKYIGDAILAVWSPAFIDEGRHAAEACHAALEQRSRLAELTRLARMDFGLGENNKIEIREGIATGDVVAGSIGPAGARNYTVVGDTVNVAARLENANKRLGTRILVAEKTYADAGDPFLFRDIGRISIAGKQAREHVYELMGLRGSCPEMLHQLAHHYEEGLAACAAREFVLAKQSFRRALDIVPADGPSQTMLSRLDRLEEEPFSQNGIGP